VIISDFERYAFGSMFSIAGVAQLGEQQTEASLWGVVFYGYGAFWRSRVQSTVLAFFSPTSEVGGGENTHDALRKKMLVQCKHEKHCDACGTPVTDD
jgi:hypothetical protein